MPKTDSLNKICGYLQKHEILRLKRLKMENLDNKMSGCGSFLKPLMNLKKNKSKGTGGLTDEFL